MKRLLLFTVITLGLLLGFSNNVFAHPGNTAADGCHYCRTNCDKWGVAWNERHCHGGYSAPASTYSPPKKLCPANSTLVGDMCSCNDNYASFKNSCIKIPTNAHAVTSATDAWQCDQGYIEKGNSCLLEPVPQTTTKEYKVYTNTDYGFTLNYNKYFYDVSDKFDGSSLTEGGETTPGELSGLDLVASFCLNPKCEDKTSIVLLITAHSGSYGIDIDLQSSKDSAKSQGSPTKIRRSKINGIPVLIEEHKWGNGYILMYTFYINDEEDIIINYGSPDKKTFTKISKDFEKMMKTFKKI